MWTVEELRLELKRKADAGEEVTGDDLIRWGVVKVLTEEEFRRRHPKEDQHGQIPTRQRE